MYKFRNRATLPGFNHRNSKGSIITLFSSSFITPRGLRGDGQTSSKIVYQVISDPGKITYRDIWGEGEFKRILQLRSPG